MPTKIEKARDYLEKEVQSCSLCQPYDGEIVWIHGLRTELADLLFEFDLTDEQIDEVLEGFQCPRCGASLEASYDEVGIKFDYEKENDKRFNQIKKRYFPKIEEFAEYLEKYPMLGLNHKVGKEFLKAIQSLPVQEINDQLWFRARKLNGLKNPNTTDLLNPNPEKIEIKEGRYNHYGQSHFYCADNEYAALTEIFSNSDGVGWIQQFRIKKLDNILDISYAPEREDVPKNLLAGAMLFSGVLRRSVLKPNYWKPEYIVPRFVADLAKSLGYKGIIYSGSEHFSNNLVIFNLTENDYEFEGVPYKKKNNDDSFWNSNSN